MNKLGVSQRRVYDLIQAKANQTHLPRPVAAIALASERGLNVSRFSTDEDLAQIRQSARVTAPRSVVLGDAPVSRGNPSKARTKMAGRKRPAPQKRRGTTVFVVHGRDSEARKAVFEFLRAVGLRPLEWGQALALTGKGSPYVGEVLDVAFREAVAIVILLTPDDDAKLRPQFLTARDGREEQELTGQARPNVLFEAGMALGRNQDSTLLVQLGDIRPFSDVGGRHVLHLTEGPHCRQEFATKLANAGCNVDTSGTDWLTAGDFAARPLRIATKTVSKRRKK